MWTGWTCPTPRPCSPIRRVHSRPPCRTVVGVFERETSGGSWDEDDPDYVPDSPPDWARVVSIGQAAGAR